MLFNANVLNSHIAESALSLCCLQTEHSRLLALTSTPPAMVFIFTWTSFPVRYWNLHLSLASHSHLSPIWPWSFSFSLPPLILCYTLLAIYFFDFAIPAVAISATNINSSILSLVLSLVFIQLPQSQHWIIQPVGTGRERENGKWDKDVVRGAASKVGVGGKEIWKWS